CDAHRDGRRRPGQRHRRGRQRADGGGGRWRIARRADPPQGRAFRLNRDGPFVSPPTANYSGSDSFTYKANDGTADSNTVTVSITVNAVNDAPVAVADSYSVNEDATLTIAAAGGTANE